MVEELNKDLPRQLDEITRMDQISKSSFTYVYHNTTTEPVRDPLELQERLTRNVTGSVCGMEVKRAG
jgi:hypothetical protein